MKIIKSNKNERKFNFRKDDAANIIYKLIKKNSDENKTRKNKLRTRY